MGYSWPFPVPGHERLRRTGTFFENHHIAADMCSASRAVIYTGLHMPHNGIFDNAGVPYMKSLDPKLPTIGKILRKLGYYTAYKGKWHLNGAMAVGEPARRHQGAVRIDDGQGLRLLRLHRHRRLHRRRAGRLPVRRHHLGPGHAMAEGQGPADDRPQAALVPRGQPRQSARRDVAQHRPARPAGAGQGRPAQDRRCARRHALPAANGTAFPCRTPGSSRSTRRAAWPRTASITRPTAT